ncbi:MAG TPA: DUF2953 domain-containing protein [Candidatus Avamphibacillus intestinigallinarum]|nr:DUF2953 domain-containing protein [Candidatus Avamphibacillus intestinigallinarum]
MLKLYIGIGVILILLWLCMYIIRKLPLHLFMEMKISEGKMNLQMRVFFRHIQLYEKSFCQSDRMKTEFLNVENILDRLKKATEQLQAYRQAVHDLPPTPKTNIMDLTWHTQIGTRNAAETGLAAGGAWTAKMLGVDLIEQYINMATQPNLFVEPAFDEKKFETVLVCMVHTKVGEAMDVMKYVKSLKQVNNTKGELNHEASN